VQQTRGCLLGGTSNFWTGRCERFHPSDFEAHPYTPANNPWPLNYEELEPYYDNADVMFRVRGGVRSHYAPPRRQPLPLPARVDVSYLRNTLGRAGVTVDDSPTATPRKGIRFFRVQSEILPSFSSRRNFTLVTGATATRLIANSNKQIVGAEIRTFEGEKKVARAKAFVIAAGGIGTPRLLLLSKSEAFPNGVGNSYDRVGKGFNEHPSVNFYAQVPHTLATLYPSNKIGRTHQFYNTYRAEGLGSILPVFRQSWILPHHNMLFSWKKVPRNLRWFGNRFIKATLYMGAVIEMKATDSNRVTLSRHKRDAFGEPLAQLECNYSEHDLLLLEKGRQLIRELYAKVGATNIYEAEITFSRHHQGTCRMGERPRTSVVDPQLRVHDCPNLYLCGAETFVTGGAMQPMMTIAALADRLGVHLVDKFASGAYQKVAELHTA
jgi:choline dehydrogenase-like flavoprotein